jgi:hypothetical protein
LLASQSAIRHYVGAHVSASSIRSALEKLSSYLLDEAAALEKETALFAITTEGSADASSTSDQSQADSDRLRQRRVGIG